MSLTDLEKILQIKFKNKKILEKSLIHKSLDPINNNEKLEFLGDRVLGFVISKKLYEIYPEETEGALDKKFASLVNKNMCLSIANKLNLSKFIKTNTNKTNNYKPENKIISDTCEAIIGAIFLDQGIKVVENFILKQMYECQQLQVIVLYRPTRGNHIYLINFHICNWVQSINRHRILCKSGV